MMCSRFSSLLVKWMNSVMINRNNTSSIPFWLMQNHWVVRVKNCGLEKTTTKVFISILWSEPWCTPWTLPSFFCLTQKMISHTQRWYSNDWQDTHLKTSYCEKFFFLVWTYFSLLLQYDPDLWNCQKNESTFPALPVYWEQTGVQCSTIIPVGRRNSGTWKLLLDSNSVLLLALRLVIFMAL